MANGYFNITNTVTKSNQLIESKYKLTLQQQKIVCAVASKVRITDTEFTKYSFHMQELAELLELNKIGYYTEVRKVIRSLQTQVFTINKIVDNEIKNIDLNWFYSAEYNETKNIVSLKFANDLKPFLLEVKDNFTSYELGNIVKLNSSYSLRIYEILRSKSFKKQFEIPLDELYSMVLSNYARYTDFKKNVLEKCKGELKEKTDISFDFEEIKTGRKVTAIKFIIKTKKPRLSDEIQLLKATNDEVSVDLTETSEESKIQQIIDIMDKHNITTREAKKIYDSSKGNMDIINKVYQDIKNKPAKSITALMISLVKPGEYIEPKSNAKTQNSIFHNIEQRAYDYEKLERELLGWDDGKEA